MTIQTILDGFYEEVAARIRSQVPEIKHIDLYYGQYDSPELDESGNPKDNHFSRPALFFEWPKEIQMVALGLRRKQCDIIFSIHLVQDVVQDVDQRTAKAIREKGHQHLSLINTVQNALEAFNGELATDFQSFGPIALVGLQPYAMMSQQIVHILGFSVRLINDSARKTFVKLSDLNPPIAATDEIEGEIEQL